MIKFAFMLIAIAYVVGMTCYHLYCLYQKKQYMSEGGRIIATYNHNASPVSLLGLFCLSLILYSVYVYGFLEPFAIFLCFEGVLIYVKSRYDIVLLEDGLLYDMTHLKWAHVHEIEFSESVLRMKTSNLNGNVEILGIEDVEDLISRIPKRDEHHFSIKFIEEESENKTE